jgi:hypothetical protein
MIWTMTLVAIGLVMLLGNLARLGLLMQRLTHDTDPAVAVMATPRRRPPRR